MREAFGAMTTRGRAFLAGGMTAIVCGVVLGERDLVRIGLLIVLLPVFSALWAGRPSHRLGLARSLESAQVEVGRPVRVRLDLHNRGRTTQPLMLEEQLPYALGSRPRFLVDPVPAGASIQLDYTVRSELRGAHRVGPLRMKVSDPFGLLELDRTFSPTDELVVTPRVEALPPITLGGSRSGSGESRPRAAAAGNAADATVREYRTGDDLRRVHWRSSAHTGQLMVRREEQPWQSRCTLVVDNRARAHRGRGPGSSLEVAIGATASIATHLVSRGYQVRVLTGAGEQISGPNPEGATDTRALLGRLATLPELGSPMLATDWIDDRVASGLFLAVLGGIEDRDRPFFSQVGRLSTTTYGLVLDVGAWAGQELDPATGWLQSIGWRASTLGPRASLRNAWQELG